MKPVDVSDLDLAFGGQDAMRRLLPAMAKIPERYRIHNRPTPMNRLVSRWFYEGIGGATFFPRDGIDKRTALRHVAAVIRSFEPKHEHKEAGCAYLIALWFERVEVDGEVFTSDATASEISA